MTECERLKNTCRMRAETMTIKTFQEWLESFELQQTIPPKDYTKRIWVSDDKNPEQISAWQRKNTRRVFTFPLSKEKFIHFTPKENVPEILKSGMLKGSSVFAISTSFGIWYPRVQFTHIKHDSDKGRAGQTQAILFQTNKPPVDSTYEEVVWHESVPVLNPQVMSTRDAIRVLKHTPHSKELMSGSYLDRVEYTQ